MKVWLVVTEQRDENGNICNYSILGVHDTYASAKERQRSWVYTWERMKRKIFYIGKDMAVSISKYGIRSVIYVEERDVR